MHDLHRIQASRQTTAFGEAPEKRMSLSPHDFNLRNHCRSLRTEMAGVATSGRNGRGSPANATMAQQVIDWRLSKPSKAA